MSLLFCHDHRFFVDDKGCIYSYGQFDHTILNRYVEIFGDVTIAARGVTLKPEDDISTLSPCSSEYVHFLWMPNLSSIGGLTVDRSAAKKKIAAAVAKADAVISRLPSEIGLIGLQTAKQLGKPAGAEVVACVWDGLKSHGGFMALTYAPIAYYRMRRAVARTSMTLYVTSNFLQKRYPTRGRQAVVSNVEIASPDPHVLDSRLDRIAALKTPTVFGMIAALFHKEKGIDIAIQALSIARRTAPRLRLKILGPGDRLAWRETVRRFGVEDSVEFCGSLPRGQKVLDWIDNIDVYVQASFQEGLPRALIEAMSRGCPTLASSAGGTPELVNGECLHTPGDAKTLAHQMIIAQDPAWQNRIAKLNFTRSGNYTHDILNARRRAFWSGLCAPQSQPT